MRLFGTSCDGMVKDKKLLVQLNLLVINKTHKPKHLKSTELNQIPYKILELML